MLKYCYRLLGMINIVMSEFIVIIFISCLISKSITNLFIYFVIESLGIILLNSIFSLLQFSNLFLSLFILFLYHICGIISNGYMFSEISRHLRLKYVWKETIEYDPDWELFSPFFDDFRLLGFYCVIAIINSFGKIIYFYMTSSTIDSLKEEKREEVRYVEVFGYWIGSIGIMYFLLCYYTSLYIAFYQLAIIWFLFNFIVFCVSLILLFTNNNYHQSTIVNNIIVDNNNNKEDEEEEENVEKIFLQCLLKLFISNPNGISNIFMQWSNLFMNLRIFENEMLIFTFAFHLNFHFSFYIYYAVLRGLILLSIPKSNNSFWLLRFSYTTRFLQENVSNPYFLYQFIHFICGFILTLINSLDWWFIGKQKVLSDQPLEQFVFGISIIIFTLFLFIENLFFTTSYVIVTGDNCFNKESKAALLERKLIHRIKQYLPILLQLLIVGSMSIWMDDPGLLTFKFYCDLSFVFQMIAFICLFIAFLTKTSVTSSSIMNSDITLKQKVE
ncbi:hypothetical protein ABK040_007773 [Willaertia magna]